MGRVMTSEDPVPTAEVVRLALVMNGGVSLAVWMGGVTHELSRLLGRDGGEIPQVWRDILNDGLPAAADVPTRRQVVVDYVAGTSAGGLNGALLATSIARGGGVPPLKDLWLKKGRLAVGSLVPKAEDRGGSILDGQFFHDAITEVVGSMSEVLDKAGDMSLMVTSTALARKRNDPDSFVAQDRGGNEMTVKDHRRVYRFQSASRADDGRSQFVDTAVLALAARASAGFPAAFAPVAETAELRERRVGWIRNDVPAGTTWLIDGGVLDNAPFEPLLDEIVSRPRSDRGSRWVVYVVPSAVNNGPEDEDDGSSHEPSWSKVVRSLWGTKSEVDLRSDVETLQRLAEESRAARVRPEDFFVTNAAAEIDVLPLLEMYRETRAEGFARFLRETNNRALKLGTREMDPDKVKQLVAYGPLFIPASLDAIRDGTRWQWGITVAQRFLLWLSRDARATPEHPELIKDLAKAERELGVIAADVLRLYKVEKYGNRDPHVVARKTATEFAGHMERTWVLMSAAVGRWAVSRGMEDAWQRLIATEVLQNHAEWHVRSAPPPFDVLLVNPGSPSVDAFVFAKGSGAAANQPDPAQVGVDHAANSLRERPNNKLYGTRLGHFAGFGASRYRSHDWLWGRLDAAACLSSALLRDLDGTTRDAARVALMADILADEKSTRQHLAEETARAESMDGPALVADMLKEGEIDADHLTDSVLDMLIRSEWDPIVDGIADDAIAGMGNFVEVVAKVVGGVARITDRVKGTAQRLLARVRGM